MKEEKISLAQGAGGAAMMKLIAEILKEFSLKMAESVGLDELDDGSVVQIGDKTLVFTTDGHVVKPLFFPGGDIGRLAICSTINDLAAMGAKTLALSCAVVLREGLPVEDCRKICRSINQTLCEVGVPLVTGDTKVMPGGDLDGIVITTAGIGVAGKLIRDSGLRPGDKIISTGTLGDHGMLILALREGINLEGLVSDLAPIWETVEAVLRVGGITAMKDVTRGGAASIFYEMATKAGVGILLEEAKIPISQPVRAASELLGIDPLAVANEGKAIIGADPGNCDEILAALHKTKYGKKAAVIGEATPDHAGLVMIETGVGGKRLLDWPAGDPAPRIC